MGTMCMSTPVFVCEGEETKIQPGDKAMLYRENSPDHDAGIIYLHRDGEPIRICLRGRVSDTGHAKENVTYDITSGEYSYFGNSGQAHAETLIQTIAAASGLCIVVRAIKNGMEYNFHQKED